MKNLRFYLTPAAGKRLIAKALVRHPDVQRALNEGTILVVSGTTNTYVANELLELIGSDIRVTVPGFHKGVTVPPGAKTIREDYPGEVVISGGVARLEADLPGICSTLKKGDVIFKGANAYSPATHTAAILIGNDATGGTIMEVTHPVIARRAKLILPVGLEKRVELPLSELAARCNDPDMSGLRLIEAAGEAFTEIDAIRLLTGSEAVMIGAGGINGAEGGIYYDAQDGDLDALKEIIRAVEKEPAAFC